MKIPIIKNQIKIYNESDPISLLQLPKVMEYALEKRNITTVGKLYRSRRKKLYKVKNLGKKSVSYLMEVKRNIKFNNIEIVGTEQFKPFVQDPYFTASSTLINKKRGQKQTQYSIFGELNSSYDHLGRNDSIDRLNIPTRVYHVLMNYGVDTVGKLFDSSQEVLYNMRNLGHKSIGYLLEIKKHLEIKSEFPQINNSEPSAPAVVASAALIESSLPCYIFNGITLDGNEPITLLELPTRIENALMQGGIGTIRIFYDSTPKELLSLRNLGPRSIEIINEVKKIIILTDQNRQEQAKTEQGQRILKQEVEISSELLIDMLLNNCKDQRTIDILRRRYGLINEDKETLEEIGDNFGVTRERIRQIQEKAIRKLRHPMVKEKKLILELINAALWNKRGIINAEEADRIIPKIFNDYRYDGSSLLDLFADIGWIQTYKIRDASFYSPEFSGLNLSVLMTEIVELLKNNRNLMNAESIAKNLLCKTVEIPVKDLSQNAASKTTSNRGTYDRNYTVYEQKEVISSDKLIQLVYRCCKLDPRVEERFTNHFTLYSLHNRRHIWSTLISKILKDEGSPLHFTEISNRLNDFLRQKGEYLDERRVYSILIESSDFAHTGVRGMYGLTKWGLRKESTQELATELLKRSGFPVHWKQIFSYISKYKDTKEQNIKNILDASGKFIKKNNGFYWIKS